MDFSTNHSLEIGDICQTLGRQVTIPSEYKIYKEIEPRKWDWQQVGDGQVAIRICGKTINTNAWNQSGLVCYLPIWARGCAILSIKIEHISNKSVRAIPLEYIELDPKLDESSIGKKADDIFQSYLGQLGMKSTWHNKAEQGG